MSDFARHWQLEPGLDYLNHGSFGACPTRVLETQAELRGEMEREPVDFFVRRLADRIGAVRDRLAQFVGCDRAGLVPVANATTGVNAVLRSLAFEPGDDLLVTDHAYNACRNTIDYVAARGRARVVVARIPFPLDDAAQVVQAVLAAATARTRIALVDHVTSPTGLVLPVAEIVRGLDERGIDTLIDGAHAPGTVALHLGSLGAAYYVGHCHKWLCAPKGAAFLWVRSDRRGEVRPSVISHGANTVRPGRTRFESEFEWIGTSDPTPFLCVPVALDLVGGLVPGGWPEVMRRNRALALEARRTLAAALGVALPCPDEMIATLAALPLPDGAKEPPSSALDVDPLQEQLRRERSIEVPIVPWPAPPRRLVRISAQLYNDRTQYERLATALGALL